MKQLTCEMCGSTDLVKQDGLFVCQTCGTKYSVEEARKMMIEGTVEVQGTVKIDESDVANNYLNRARIFLEDGDWNSANEYFDKVLDINSNNAQAYLGKFLTYAEIKSEKDIIKYCAIPYVKNSDSFKKALRFSTGQLKDYLESLLKELEDDYLNACHVTKKEQLKKGVTDVIIPDGTTSISDYAFYGCSSLTSMEIPNSVTSIGANAFSGCRSLTSVTIGDGVTSIGNFAFSDCSKLTSVTIPNSVTSIGSSAFYNCYSLTSIEIPNSVTSIGNGALYACDGLTSIVIGSNVTSIGYDAFNGCRSLESITLPFIGATKDGTTNTHFGYIFGANYSYKYDYVPASLKTVIITGGSSIGQNAFSGCSSLTSIEIPNSVTSIGDGAFSGCSGLTSIEIPNSVTSIGDWAFENCSSLTSIEIPNSITGIGWGAFSSCSRLKSVNYLGTIDEWVQIEFDNEYSNPIYCAKNLYINDELVTQANITTATKINNFAFRDCSSLTSVTIGNSVTSIGSCAFSDCSSLTSIEIPNSVTSIGDYAFDGCSSLTSIEIPNSVTSIGTSTFFNCSSLTSVTIGNGVEEIGEKAFYHCNSLTSVTIPKSVKTIREEAFKYCENLTSLILEDHTTYLYIGAVDRYSVIKRVKKTEKENKKQGCYVATCVYGSYDCPEVWTLRRYRDNTLGSTWYGRAFIKLYYAISPTIVKWFGKTNWFKKMWKGKLDRMVKKLQDNGVKSTPYEDKQWK